jgi:hypothetical protein
VTTKEEDEKYVSICVKSIINLAIQHSPNATDITHKESPLIQQNIANLQILEALIPGFQKQFGLTLKWLDHLNFGLVLK